MQCQVPGCKKRAYRTCKARKDGVFMGIHLDNVVVYTCGCHSEAEVDAALEKVGEEEASSLQDCNPFASSEIFRQSA